MTAVGTLLNPTERLEIRDSRDTLLAWATQWLVEAAEDELIYAVPKLYLSQDAAEWLVASQPYDSVFAGAHIHAPSRDSRAFITVHASFELYRTGEPVVVDYAAITVGRKMPDIRRVISRAAAMLRI